MWYNKYIGIPYKDKGRDSTGVDCWGLVRLVYEEKYQISLPSFVDAYESGENSLISEAISERKESWQQVKQPEAGDVVLFEILGHASHLGVCLGADYFIHAREGIDQVVLESLSSRTWKNRVQGFYRYHEKTQANLVAQEHPFKREHFTEPVVPGTTVLELVDQIKQKHNIYTETTTECVLFINGTRIPEKDFATTKVAVNDQIEFRSVFKGSSGLRNLLILAVVITAYVYGGALGAAAESAVTGVATTTTGTMTVAGVEFATATVSAGWAAAGAIAINIAGFALINAIAPIRQPKTQDPGQAEGSELFNGGSNPLAPYTPIPVVLGRVRYTPPLGAQQIVEFEDPNKSRLNTLVVWGFGPLKIEDIQIGTKNLSEFGTNAKEITYYGQDGETFDITDQLYPSDITQHLTTSPQELRNIQVGTLEADGETNPSILRNNIIVNITTQVVDRIKLALHFPQGLRTVKVRGDGAGSSSAAPFEANYTLQKIDVNGDPVGSVISSQAIVKATTHVVPPVQLDETSFDSESSTYNTYYTDLYQWIRVCVYKDNSVNFIYGTPTENKDLEPTSELISRLYGTRYSSLVSQQQTGYSRIPSIPADAVEIHRFCMFGSTGFVSGTHVNYTTTLQNVTGLGITFSGRTVSLAAGSFTGVTVGETIRGKILLGSLDQAGNARPRYIQVNSFTHVEDIIVEPSRYRIEISRDPSVYSNADYGGALEPVVTAQNEIEYKRYNQCFVYGITGYSTSQKPIVQPPGCKIAKTALSIVSNKNLTGTLEGVNGLVTSICRDYNSSTQQWTNLLPTSNPASLFLHVLTHPANAYRVLPEDEATQINFTQLAEWWTYCNNQGFTYNNIVSNITSVLDLLKDIAASGRASPTLIDGKWSVIIDRPRIGVTQYFTPNNSWGFSASKILPRQPHAFRVSFRNEEKAYQDDSIIIPNKGYSESTAQIIEEISIPGLTKKEIAAKHARFHLAQLKLRPEIYTLNTDIEYLICNRGDLVKVAHDIPSWGSGSGRIKNIVSSTEIELDNTVPLEVNKTYTIIIRTDQNQAVERTITSVGTSGYYTTLTLTQALPNTVKVLDLYMVGEVNQVVQELIVTAIEPQDNFTARLTLVDYSPQIYNVDTELDWPSINYNVNYTKLPKFLLDVVTTVPILTNTNQIVSDESVLTKTAGGALINNIRIGIVNPEKMDKRITSIEIEYDYASNTATDPQFKKIEPITTGYILLENVEESRQYKIRARYRTDVGLVGSWTEYILHTVVGKTSLPGSVASGTIQIQDGKFLLNWSRVTDLDIEGYEVRLTDSGWGT